jgi:adenine-specific DNA-methyltransferase
MVVLDFFSGSGTTAHAVMQLNAEDGGNRKWIMVQLPEETDEKSEAYKAGYKTIPDIARERIRRAGDKIAKEHPDAKVDYGFRALKIDDLNEKDVHKTPGQYQQDSLLDSVDNIKEDRSDLDLLYGVLIKSALELNKPIQTKDSDSSKVYMYDYFGEVSGLIACFEKNISETVVKEIAKLKPLTAVFRDSSFPDSQAKINLSEHFRMLSPETKVKVI